MYRCNEYHRHNRCSIASVDNWLGSRVGEWICVTKIASNLFFPALRVVRVYW
jgi:hypothetical protein